MSMLLLWAMVIGTHDVYAAKVKIEGNHGKYLTCMKRIARHYHIPFNVFFAMAKTEGGWIGLYRGNKPHKNGSRTYDIGLMQINSSWMGIFKNQFNVSARTLANNGCVNILFAAKIFDYERTMLRKRKKKMSVWDVVGNYHSKDQGLQNKYIKRVVEHFSQLGMAYATK